MQLKYQRVNIELPIGSTGDKTSVDMPYGETVAAAVFFTGNDPAEPINIGVENLSGGDIIPPTHYKDWISGNGEYLKSMKPMFFTDRQVQVVFESTDALTAVVKAQVVFVVKTP